LPVFVKEKIFWSSSHENNRKIKAHLGHSDFPQGTELPVWNFFLNECDPFLLFTISRSTANSVKNMATLKHIQNNSSTVLNLSGRVLNDECFDALVQVLNDHALEGLILDMNTFWRIEEKTPSDENFNKLAVALHDTTLKSISLRGNYIEGNYIDSRRAELLSRAFAVNTSLEDIDLHHNRIGDEGVLAISQAVIANKGTKLKRLDLGRNGIEHTGCRDLAKMLLLNTTIEELMLSHNRFLIDCLHFSLSKLTDALINNRYSKLSKLHLNECSIGNDDVIHLANLLRGNKTLTHLHLEDNLINSAGVEALALALQENNTLEELDLNNNRFDAVGAHFLAEMLKVNEGLRKLRLSRNDIGDEGAKFLAAALIENKSLLDLNLFNCSIKLEGIFALMDTLRLNTPLRRLNFDDEFGFDEDPDIRDFNFVEMAEDVFRRNTNIIEMKPPVIDTHGLLRNNLLYRDALWLPLADFPQSFHDLLTTFFLCNQEYAVRLPWHIIQYIASFRQRKDFLE